MGTVGDGGGPGIYPVDVGDGRSTEELVAAGAYDYAHSCVTSENFPARPGSGTVHHVVLLEAGAEAVAGAVLAGAAALGLTPPRYEDALHFGIAHPHVQRWRPVVFLHEPWLGYFGRRDVISLWCNAGRRELGLDDFDGGWGPECLFAFMAPGAGWTPPAERAVLRAVSRYATPR